MEVAHAPIFVHIRNASRFQVDPKHFGAMVVHLGKYQRIRHVQGEMLFQLGRKVIWQRQRIVQPVLCVFRLDSQRDRRTLEVDGSLTKTLDFRPPIAGRDSNPIKQISLIPGQPMRIRPGLGRRQYSLELANNESAALSPPVGSRVQLHHMFQRIRNQPLFLDQPIAKRLRGGEVMIGRHQGQAAVLRRQPPFFHAVGADVGKSFPTAFLDHPPHLPGIIDDLLARQLVGPHIKAPVINMLGDALTAGAYGLVDNSPPRQLVANFTRTGFKKLRQPRIRPGTSHPQSDQPFHLTLKFDAGAPVSKSRDPTDNAVMVTKLHRILFYGLFFTVFTGKFTFEN